MQLSVKLTEKVNRVVKSHQGKLRKRNLAKISELTTKLKENSQFLAKYRKFGVQSKNLGQILQALFIFDGPVNLFSNMARSWKTFPW